MTDLTAPIDDEAVKAIFHDCGAVLEGHFVLTSGRHSPTFLQKARVFMDAAATERLCRALAQKILEGGFEPEVVVGPAVGGIIPAYETSRHLSVPSVWVEREEGRFRLRRFELAPGTRCVVVEDIVTTGLSIRETVEALRATGLEVAAAACLVDRSGGSADVGVPLVSLSRWTIPTYAPDEVPPELAALPATKPGSRSL